MQQFSASDSRAATLRAAFIYIEVSTFRFATSAWYAVNFQICNVVSRKTCGGKAWQWREGRLMASAVKAMGETNRHGRLLKGQSLTGKRGTEGKATHERNSK